jgi:ABC-type multidrug transport system ATPase subunit
MVDHTVRILGLGSVQSQQIGTPISRGISGGQKRRVTIGCAIVSRPRVLLLDEPTSGLDSLSGREVIRASRSSDHLLQYIRLTSA